MAFLLRPGRRLVGDESTVDEGVLGVEGAERLDPELDDREDDRDLPRLGLGLDSGLGAGRLDLDLPRLLPEEDAVRFKTYIHIQHVIMHIIQSTNHNNVKPTLFRRTGVTGSGGCTLGVLFRLDLRNHPDPLLESGVPGSRSLITSWSSSAISNDSRCCLKVGSCQSAMKSSSFFRLVGGGVHA